MHIRILDKYIFRETLRTFLFGIAAFSIVFLGTGTLFRIAQYITEYGASFTSVLKIFVLSLPGVIIYTFPMSMLLSSLLTFGRLSSSSEITAMKSCGIGFNRIATPAIILGAVVSIFAIAFNEYVVPWSNDAYSHVLNYEIRGNMKPQSQEHIIVKEIDQGTIQRLVYARKYDAEANEMIGVTMQDFEDGNVRHVENAEYAEWQNQQWVLHNGMIYDVSDGHSRRTMHFSEQVLPINESPNEIVRAQKTPEEMTMKELKMQIKAMQSQFVDTKKLETEFYQRITVPMASLIFTLVGIPLALQPSRSSSSAGFALSIVIIFAYYAMMTLASSIAQSGAVDPAVAVWLPNAVGLIAGIYLMRRAAR